MNINEYNLINNIYKYIMLKQQIPLIQLKKDFKNLIIGINANYSEDLFDYNKNFYYIIDFLLINGYIEYSDNQNSDSGVYVFPTKNKAIKYNDIYYIRDIQNLFYKSTQTEIKDFITLDPINILKAIPKVEDVCNSFPTNDFKTFKFKYDKHLKLKRIHQDLINYNYEVGIYKINDFGLSFLVLEDHTIKRISRKNQNYDSLNSAFCYSAIFSGIQIFKYNQKKENWLLI